MPDRDEAGNVFEPDRETVRRVLGETIDTVEQEGIDYLVIGGLASARWGRPGEIGDVDVFVREDDGERLLKKLAERGYAAERPELDWLYKATKNGLTVDIIFEAKRGIRLDAEMLQRGRALEIEGRRALVASPEDLVIMLAASDVEETPYWHNALHVLASQRLDWRYLARRAETAPDRALSLLLYARSDGVDVPSEVLARLCEVVAARPS